MSTNTSPSSSQRGSLQINRKKRPSPAVNKPLVESESFLKPVMENALRSLDLAGEGFVSRRDFLKLLHDTGLKSDDPRLVAMFEKLMDEPDRIPMNSLVGITALGGHTVLSALTGGMVIPEFNAFKEQILKIFEEIRSVDKGEVASYIPQLAKVPRDKFAVAVTTVDGQQFSFGDDMDFFCLQSVSKPVTYCEAVKQHGTHEVHQHVGREPSGVKFNAMAMKQMDPSDEKPDRIAVPHNPLINSGAIMCTSLMNPQLPLAERLSEYLTTWSRMCGETVGFDPTVMVSERGSADRNNVLAYMMRECGAFAEKDIDLQEVLELYFSTCSVTCNAQMMATAASVFANCGVNPLTNDCIYDAETCRNALSLMLSCGMYDFSGEWAFSVGLPAKSGVSGVILLVIPDVLGMCIWAPPLDENGNSCKGIDFAKRLVDEFSFHSFEPKRNMASLKNDVGRSDGSQNAEVMTEMMYAAAANDISSIQRLISTGADINAADYDKRTVLHIAASEGHENVVEFLLHHNADPSKTDRWGNMPIDDAKRENHPKIVKLLSKVQVETSAARSGSEL